MGYYVTFMESTAKFKVKNVNKIINAIKEHNKISEDYYRILSASSNNIKEIFEEMDLEIVKSGKYYKIERYISEKLGEQEVYFPVIAPHMEDGFIHMVGEEGNHWKWKFNKGKFREVAGSTVFDDEYHIEIEG